MANRKDRAPEERGGPRPRRAGLRHDERDPDDPTGEPGSAAGGIHMAGSSGGGMASGGMAGTNEGDGSTDDVEIEDDLGSNLADVSSDTEVSGPPYAGISGGAVGGTPAEKRAKGGHVRGGFSPDRSTGADRTIGGDPHRPTG